jgi:hypothetical protein
MLDDEHHFPQPTGVEGTDSGEVWMLTAISVILLMSVSLLGTSFFFLIKETHFSAYSLLVTSRCAIRGPGNRNIDEVSRNSRCDLKLREEYSRLLLD